MATVKLWGRNQSDGRWHFGISTEYVEQTAVCGATVLPDGFHADMREGHEWARRGGVCADCKPWGALHSIKAVMKRLNDGRAKPNRAWGDILVRLGDCLSLLDENELDSIFADFRRHGVDVDARLERGAEFARRVNKIMDLARHQGGA